MEGAEGEVFKTKEYWLILYLIWRGMKFEVECRDNSHGRKYLMWSFPKAEGEEANECYRKGELMEIELHGLREAAEVFKRNLAYFGIGQQ